MKGFIKPFPSKTPLRKTLLFRAFKKAYPRGGVFPRVSGGKFLTQSQISRMFPSMTQGFKSGQPF
jgi:hypothetical protein